MTRFPHDQFAKEYLKELLTPLGQVETALELLYNLRVILETNQNLDAEDRELIMELSPLYLERLDEATQQGIQQGESIVVENLLRVRFGVLDEELQSIVAPLLELPPEEFTSLLLQLSRDELLARFIR